jgi:glycerol kinase
MNWRKMVAGSLPRKGGLPLATYFSGPKVKWVLDNVEGVRAKAEKGEISLVTLTPWVIWNLTGGPKGGVHVTDVTNASRTMMMNLETLDWDPDMLKVLGVPRAMLPTIKASSEVYGTARTAVWKAFRLPVTSATSRQLCSARPATIPAKPRTLTELAASCC